MVEEVAAAEVVVDVFVDGLTAVEPSSEVEPPERSTAAKTASEPPNEFFRLRLLTFFASRISSSKAERVFWFGPSFPVKSISIRSPSGSSSSSSSACCCCC